MTSRKTILIALPGPNGRLRTERVTRAQRAPIKLACYTPGERRVILELALLLYVQKSPGTSKRDFALSFRSALRVQRCEELQKDVDVANNRTTWMLDDFLGHKLCKKNEGGIVLTEKGLKFIRRQAPHLRSAAEKIIYTDVLDRLARIQ